MGILTHLRPLAITDIYYLTILEIHDYSLVYMALADCKLIGLEGGNKKCKMSDF